MKAVALLLALSLAAPAGAADIAAKRWSAGATDCRANPGASHEVHRHDPATYVLRQSKCAHFEAPFIYVLFGDDTAFVQDTGATDDATVFEAVDELVRERSRATGRRLDVLVTHSHSHADHTAGDAHFRGRPGITLIEPTPEAVGSQLGFVDWPNVPARISLGGRTLVVIPVPGHQEESVAVHDPHTGWLLTGDTLYPGRIVVKDWDAYRASIVRMADYTRGHRVTAILGTHIETGEILALPVEDLFELERRLKEAGPQPAEIATPRFVVTPMGAMQRALSTIGKWLR